MRATMTAPPRRRRRSGRSTTAAAMEKTCICRNAVACKGLTAGFACLDDPRGGFVRLPRYEPNPTSDYYVERNAQRAAYLRHLRPDHPTEEETEAKHVAMHHFHARIVAGLSPQRRFPKALSAEDMETLGLTMRDEERVLDEDGVPTGFYVFVPTYPLEMAKNDIKRLLGICKEVNTEEEKKKHSLDLFAYDLTNLSEPTGSGSPTPGAAFLDSDSEEENSDSMGKFLPWHLKQDVIRTMPPSPPRLSHLNHREESMHQRPIAHSFAEF